MDRGRLQKYAEELGLSVGSGSWQSAGEAAEAVDMLSRSVTRDTNSRYQLIQNSEGGRGGGGGRLHHVTGTRAQDTSLAVLYGLV